MAESRVSSRYAKSLIDLALEQNKLEEVNKDMVLFIDVCRQSQDLVKLFRNPVIDPASKLSIVKKIFSSSINPLTLLFLETVIKKNREFFITDIAGEFRKAYNLMKGILTASVTTAVTIDDKLKSEIRVFIEQQTKKQVELSANTNTDIIGGLVIRMDDKLFDASIASKLAAIKKNLINPHLSN
ncbi:MAG: ATP synthase F1 subunit delta [Bacteroidia bacterium]|nr:ATP synthase F1 subunit delta [Bacteroidia bacterium]